MSRYESLATELTARYKQVLSEKNSNDYKSLSASFKNIVLSSPLARQLPALFQTILKYEDTLAQETCLERIDLEKIYSEVDKSTAEQDECRKVGKLKVELGYTDLLVKELLRWFKQDFFKWVTVPETTQTQGKAKYLRVEAPTATEIRDGGASNTEVYQCEADDSMIRFPRYNNPVKLLETRCGRCGEWTNCFSLILRSFGIRMRYIWNCEDHVWCEFYSESQRRWIHLDPCENAFDNPTLYNKGWKKKMSYVFAFGIDGAVDVSRRYISDDNTLARDKIDEVVLKKILRFLTVNQRKNMTPDEIYKLVIEDNIEQMELNGIKPSYTAYSVEPRQSGSAEWTNQRGEAGK